MLAKVFGLLTAIVLLSAVLVIALSADNPAEAKPSKQSPTHKYSKWVKNKVCGDQLCDDKPIYKTKQKIGGKGSPNK